MSDHLNCSRELIQIQTLSRHGERSPRFTYSSDPYKHLWTTGPGQLTSNGISQLKEVGSFLRKTYGELLPIIFQKKDVHIRCSDADRTIVSGLSAMSTLFEHQIVPIHTVPESFDLLLKLSYTCPVHEILLSKEFELEKNKNIISQYNTFFKELGAGTNISNVDFHMALNICDAVTMWSHMNLNLPKWLNQESVDKCFELGDIEYSILYSNMALTKFRGGPLLHHMVDNMVKRAQSYLGDKSGLRMIGFFAHDSTISGLLGHIGSFNQVKPPLASTVILEVHYDAHSNISPKQPLSQFYVRLLFRNDTKTAPYLLAIPLCNNLTNPVNGAYRLDLLNDCLQPYKLKDLSKECGLRKSIDFCLASEEKLKLFHDSAKINEEEPETIIQMLKEILRISVKTILWIILIMVLFGFIKFVQMCSR